MEASYGKWVQPQISGHYGAGINRFHRFAVTGNVDVPTYATEHFMTTKYDAPKYFKISPYLNTVGPNTFDFKVPKPVFDIAPEDFAKVLNGEAMPPRLAAKWPPLGTYTLPYDVVAQIAQGGNVQRVVESNGPAGGEAPEPDRPADAFVSQVSFNGEPHYMSKSKIHDWVKGTHDAPYANNANINHPEDYASMKNPQPARNVHAQAYHGMSAPVMDAYRA
jgi:hypothetical protein